MTTKIFSHVFAVAGIALCLSPTQATAQTVTTTAPAVVPAVQEWATVSMQDPIDMNQWTDLSYYGKQFENSAYNLFAAGLKPGTYDLVVYPHRIESNAFDGAQVVRITVR